MRYFLAAYTVIGSFHAGWAWGLLRYEGYSVWDSLNAAVAAFVAWPALACMAIMEWASK